MDKHSLCVCRGVRMWVCVCHGASECACLHAALLFVCLCWCVSQPVNVCVRRPLIFMFSPSTAAAAGMNGCCVCASLELKVDLCYSTTRWQNAAILQTEPMLGWPRYCNSS